jgi:zinc protease
MRLLKLLLLFLVLTALFLLPGFATAAPSIQHWTTANGARVYFISTPELPMVDIQVVFDAGSARDNGLPGLARLTNVLLDSGTAQHSADAIAERLDAVGAQFSSGTLRDMAWLSLRSLSDPLYFKPAVETVAHLLQAPAFAPQALERERNRIIAAVRELSQSPDALAEQAFYRALYGTHPYASPPEGTEASLKVITREAVRAFYQRYYVANNAVVAIVGDLERAAAEELAVALVGNLPVGQPAPPLPKASPLAKANTVHIPYPSSQTHIYIGQLGMKRGDSDYYSLYLGNHVLGGNGLVSKLTEEVREKRGLSYGVYSYFAPMAQAGPFVVALQTRNAQADQAVNVVKSTLQDFIENGPNAEGLTTARQNLTGGFALRIDSNGELVQYLAMLGFYQLPLDHLQTFPNKIEDVSREQISSAFQQHIQPQRLITIMVGGT